jgi:hypothetical protein
MRCAARAAVRRPPNTPRRSLVVGCVAAVPHSAYWRALCVVLGAAGAEEVEGGRRRRGGGAGGGGAAGARNSRAGEDTGEKHRDRGFRKEGRIWIAGHERVFQGESEGAYLIICHQAGPKREILYPIRALRTVCSASHTACVRAARHSSSLLAACRLMRSRPPWAESPARQVFYRLARIGRRLSGAAAAHAVVHCKPGSRRAAHPDPHLWHHDLQGASVSPQRGGVVAAAAPARQGKAKPKGAPDAIVDQAGESAAHWGQPSTTRRLFVAEWNAGVDQPFAPPPAQPNHPANAARAHLQASATPPTFSSTAASPS